MAILGGEKAQLRAPDSYAAALDVAVGLQTNPRRALWAALALCWPVFSRPYRRKMAKDHPWQPLNSTLAGSGFDALAFGGAVLDELTARGLSLDEIGEAAGEAIEMLTSILPEDEDVDAIEGNSGAQGDSTS